MAQPVPPVKPEFGCGDEGVDDVGDGGAFVVGELVEVGEAGSAWPLGALSGRRSRSSRPSSAWDQPASVRSAFEALPDAQGTGVIFHRTWKP